VHLVGYKCNFVIKYSSMAHEGSGLEGENILTEINFFLTVVDTGDHGHGCIYNSGLSKSVL
jgi:hypothetical protein